MRTRVVLELFKQSVPVSDAREKQIRCPFTSLGLNFEVWVEWKGDIGNPLAVSYTGTYTASLKCGIHIAYATFSEQLLDAFKYTEWLEEELIKQLFRRDLILAHIEP